MTIMEGSMTIGNHGAGEVAENFYFIYKDEE